jgi:hypothetical protein
MATDPFASVRQRLQAQQRSGFTSSGARIVGTSETMASGGVIQRGTLMRRAPSIVQSIAAGGGPYVIPGGGSGFSSPIDIRGGIEGAVAGATQPGGGWVQAGVGFLGGLFNQGGGSETPSGSPTVPGFVAGGGTCPDGTISILGRCLNKPGGQLTGGGMFIGGGEAVLGLYGAAMAPAVQTRAHRTCIPGMVLGKDGLCYNKSQLRKSERAHVPPRKPLMTGGDLNAISRAARVARSVERQTKRLQSLGMIKKPTTRRPLRKKC